MVDIVSSLENLRHVGAQFLIADLETAITFTNIALTAKDQSVINRNRRNALKAYHSILNLASKSRLSEADADAVSTLLARLKAKLVQLAEKSASACDEAGQI